ncbi:hypothetical protein GCM10009122_28540 [Fulvivirga kasyanovii]|uniref:GSKIP domain-containing protein n=1 Tax=Fulvivirga kasyanovii TaxID=396812 RepID=A0ABW9RIY0_9BACT|nr:hypothetical protein [Fulvivirga kasyanovii]MTI23881.1 hypothetical protein [Fulvivirga kasyanovii]
MRVIGEIPHASCKITIFHWNGKYIVKLEQGLLEQSYKIDETEIIDPDEIKNVLNEEFMQSVLKRFRDMHVDLMNSLETL